MSSKTKEAVPVSTDVRLHDLAKELGISSKVLVEKAKELWPKDIKSHSSIVNQGRADRLRTKFEVKKKAEPTVVEEAFSTNRTVAAQAGEAGADMPADVETETAVAVAELEVAAPPEFTATEEIEAVPAAVEVAPPEEAVALVAEPPPPPAAEQPVAPPAPEELEADEELPRMHVPEPAPKPAPKPSPFGVVTPAPPPMPKPAAKAPAVKPPPPKPPEPKPAAVHPTIAALSGPPRKVISTPEVAPPVRREQKIDPRFGVVVPAAEAEKIHGPTKPRRGAQSVQVESKTIEEFKPQVSYPSIQENFGGGGGGGGEAEDDRARRGVAAVRRIPGRAPAGLKGFSTGPRRGVALLRGDDERQRGARRPKQNKNLEPRPVARREGAAEVTSPVSVKALCEALGIKQTALIKKFFEQGKIVNPNQILSDEEAELYALEFDPLKFGIVIKKARDVEEELLKKAEVADKPEDLKSRAPVVTIMGHVDHGKTSLLDYIRNAKVAAGEAGGITQHIGAYKVPHTKGNVTFLDTPGHRAFTEMRARGANVTDVVVLVVAANDGVMPQTEEAISHARQANKRIVVALNKIDLPEANPDKVKGQLASKELFVEGYGGDAGCVEVSAKTGKGVDELLDRILLESEVLELKANPDKHAAGTVVEAHKDGGRGIVCTLLVQEGTLQQGDIIICGHAYGSVRQIFADTGKLLKEAGPSTPVLVTGLSDVPLSGERFHVLDSIKTAAEIAEQRAMRMRQEGLAKRKHVTLETLSDMLAQGAVAALKVVLKVDVQGSLAPLRNAITELSTADARVDVLHDGVGAINETDVLLADASDAIVIGFSVTADPGARRLAEERGVEIRSYNIIYDVVDEMRKGLEGILKPIEREVIQGHLAVRQVFKISKVGAIAGCFVTDGIIQRNSGIRLVRDGKPVWTGKLAGLKRVKDDTKEVRSGFECGVKLDSFDDIKQGDLMEAFTTEQVKRTLDMK